MLASHPCTHTSRASAFPAQSQAVTSPQTSQLLDPSSHEKQGILVSRTREAWTHGGLWRLTAAFAHGRCVHGVSLPPGIPPKGRVPHWGMQMPALFCHSCFQGPVSRKILFGTSDLHRNFTRSSHTSTQAPFVSHAYLHLIQLYPQRHAFPEQETRTRTLTQALT